MAARSEGSSSPKNKARLGLESLESREVPVFTGGLSNGVLTINGTAAGDTITVRQSGDLVTLDGYSNRWSASQISSVRLNGGAGNDTITMSTSPQLAAKLRADGGTGSDALYTTAQPLSWLNFEVGKLISAPPSSPGGNPGSNSGGGSTTTTVNGVTITWSGNTGPYTVCFYRRGDSPNGGELDGIYSTQAQAQQAVVELQQWAARINSGGYWDVVRITVEGENTAPPPGQGPRSFPPPGPTTLTAHGYWGGENRAPAEQLGARTPERFAQLESWALDLMNKGMLPRPIDAADYAAMLHDIRLKWARDHVASYLHFNSKNPWIAYINQLARQDFVKAAANPNLGSAAKSFASHASYVFWYYSTYVN